MHLIYVHTRNLCACTKFGYVHNNKTCMHKNFVHEKKKPGRGTAQNLNYPKSCRVFKIILHENQRIRFSHNRAKRFRIVPDPKFSVTDLRKFYSNMVPSDEPKTPKNFTVPNLHTSARSIDYNLHAQEK